MLFSLNCLVSEQTPNDILNVPIGESFTSERKVNIKFTDMNVANFKEQLYRTKEVKKANITKMNIYKVELELDSLEDDKTYTKDDINGTIMKPGHDLNEYFNDAEKKPKKSYLHIFIIPTPTATRQKRHADSESVDIEFVDTKPKRKKDIPTLESLIVDLEEKIPLDRPPELYSISNIAGRFYKRDIPISSREYVDMRLDVKTTDTGRKLINDLKNETKACYLLYAVSGAGKTRAIFDMSMNENGIYVVYVKCRPSSDINRDYEPTADHNFAQLVASIEFTARVLYLILLKKKFPGITPRDYLLSQLNGGQECIANIRNELRLFGCDFDDLISIISSALRHLKDKLPSQKSLIFAIDESNVASNKLFSGYFRNINNNPRGLLTPMIEILRLFEISIVIAGTAFTLKQGSNIQRDIGKGSKAKYIINFNTTASKGVKAYIMRYLELSDCKIDDIEDSKYLVGRPRLMARLIKEIINAEKVSQENKQMVLEYAVNKTVQSIKNDMMDHLEVIVNKAYEKEDWENAELRKILMTLFINCWFFDGYVSKSEIDDDSAKLVNCGIASLKSDKDEKFWQVKEPLAIDVVKIVLRSQYNKPTEPLIEKLLYELRQSAYYSNISKGFIWEYLVIGRLMDFNGKTVSEFVNEIYGDDQPHMPDWAGEAIIDIESYGDLKMLSRLDAKLKDDVDVIESLLYESKFSKYMFKPGHLVRPDGIYIRKLDRVTYWTLLISAKMYTDKLSGTDVNDDQRSTNWNLLYHKKNGEANPKCYKKKERLNDVCHKDFTCKGSLRIHYIFPGVAKECTSNQSEPSIRGGCYTENNDIIMYIDEELLEHYFKKEDADILKKILT
ncbi:hypothetical protein RhiirA5_465643 [Rhizophagus irregularis]|uniref:Crinkler family protein n=1 Tax=Rhizophagus irregularis TaxID=588596 RepID=A0A2N0NU75_9GLOM|nr:hypothetical protein RhiirA5_465643 [Rhizophagus irregularis]